MNRRLLLVAIVSMAVELLPGGVTAQPRMDKPTGTKPPESEGLGSGTAKGVVQKVDTKYQSITLDDGTKIVLPSTILTKKDKERLKAGAWVSAEYDMKGTAKVATSILVRPGGCPEGSPCPDEDESDGKKKKK